MTCLRSLAFVLLTLMLAGPALGQRASPVPSPSPSPSTEQQGEFVPVSELPPQDQLPAAPLLIAAYGIVWVGLFGYLFSLARRLGSVQQEMKRLETDLKRDAHSR